MNRKDRYRCRVCGCEFDGKDAVQIGPASVSCADVFCGATAFHRIGPSIERLHQAAMEAKEANGRVK